MKSCLAVGAVVAAAIVGASSSASPIAAASLSPSAVLDWNQIAVSTVRSATPPKFQPEGLIYMSYVQAAVYDAVTKIDGRYVPYHDLAIDPSLVADASTDAAIAAAAYTTLVYYFPAQAAALKATYDAYVAGLPDEGKADGIAVGEASAADLIDFRMNDGRNAPSDPNLGLGPLEPGVWQVVPPATSAQTPWLASMTPFILDDASRFRAHPPPALGSSEYAEQLNEVKGYGALNSTVRSPQQTAVAYFWHGNAINQYNQAFRDVAIEHGFDVVDAARALAMGNLVGSDALIECWVAKYQYSFWRPYTAIRNAEIDGNPATDPDPTWLPLVNTPNHPEYPSAHGCLTGAEAEVFSAVLGTNRIDVKIWGGQNGATTLTTSRRFEMVNDLDREIVDARVRIGFHFRGSVVAGVALGRKVAKYDLRRAFQRSQPLTNRTPARATAGAGS
jgi:hypothetical protein